MRYRIFSLALVLINTIGNLVYAQQDAPNDINTASSSGMTTALEKWAATPVNLFTGIPNISIPIYHYQHHNGLKLDISLDYFGGGTKVNELPTPEGLNWILNAGGAITRTVRGMPDDSYPKGSMYGSTLPLDPTTNAFNYYHDSLDAELDVFQYNFNGRSGRFYIGNNKQIRIVPLSKMKIAFDTSSVGISTFRITTEDGVKYIFSDREYGIINNADYKSGYSGKNFTSAWYLSQIIAAFGTDTIKFTYNTTGESDSVAFSQTVYVDNSNINNVKYFAPKGTQSLYVKKLAGIVFPDKKNIAFIYDRTLKYDGFDSSLNRINIGDSIFRYGYLLDWTCCKFNDTVTNGRAFLGGIRSYTQTSVRPEYKFSYYNYLFPSPSTPGNFYSNRKDHWGYFNGFTNDNVSTEIPTIPLLYTGATRDPSSQYAMASTLASISDPTGGITYYQFESNDLPQFSTTPMGVTINALNNTQTTISLSQAYGNLYTFYLNYDLSYGRNSVLTGSCSFTCSVTSLDGLTTFGSITTSLYQLSTGIRFMFNAPNGSYLLKTTISGCSSTLNTLPVDINWQNQAITGSFMTSGGIRLKQQTHFDPISNRTDTIATYTYRNSDGKSSGFLGAIPIYTYPYSQTVINGTTVTTNYTAICSDPINDLNYTQGSPIGYGHVEVFKGTPSHNLGKTAYDFTTLSDANASLISPFFPYAPLSQRDWKLGLTKRVAVYDSTGKLISVTQNSYTDTLVSDTNINFRSRKLGKASTTYNGDPNNLHTPYTEYYANSDYFTETGNSLVSKIIDSFYHSDNSLQIIEKDLLYDTNYNLIKTTEPYDQTGGLTIEKRFYYPYNYTISSGPIKKLKDSSILSWVISTESWITGDANPRIVGAQITDYQQLTKGHIKPLTVYSLQSNVPVAQSVIGQFSPTSLIRNSTYLVGQQSFPTYDTMGNVLEIKNLQSGQSNSIVMGYYNQFPVATITNSSYANVAYTSFESDGNGNWTIPSLNRNNSSYLTGKLCYDLASGNISTSALSSAVSYIISVWAKTGATVNVNGIALAGPIALQNGWNLYTKLLTGITTATVSGSGLIDELRLYPKDANISTKTYEPMLGTTSTCDANNTVDYYLFDFDSRLKLIKDKDLNVLKEFEFDTTTINVNTNPNWYGSGAYQCETPLNGNVDVLMWDNGPYSYTYNTGKWVFGWYDCVLCKPACGQGGKLINCVCVLGTRHNISSVWTKVNGTTWKWRCTYQYCWSDGTSSSLYTEDNDTPCTVTGGCIN